MARYVMTPRRRAALRKAQLASARRRRKGAKAAAKSRRQPLKHRALSKIQGKNPHSRRSAFVAEKSARYSKAGRSRAKANRPRKGTLKRKAYNTHRAGVAIGILGVAVASGRAYSDIRNAKKSNRRIR